ncbi:hypothetical protein BGL_1c33280 [Burkholderia plantarii]|uniref:Uncharacterized protein n=1 Tax=Burkholderia plantarii TaxID=41899 RepID=A0A0B6RR39_BURPL|nr:hypothetical protein BGL_1c33280 [Burkholderia plantarii]
MRCLRHHEAPGSSGVVEACDRRDDTRYAHLARTTAADRRDRRRALRGRIRRFAFRLETRWRVPTMLDDMGEFAPDPNHRPTMARERP